MIKRIVTPGMAANCYLVSCEKTNKAFIIDPGAGCEMILNTIKENKMDISLIILTHGHFDHIGAVESLRKDLQAKVAIHKNDADMLVSSEKNLSRFVGMDIALSPADILLEDDENCDWRVGSKGAAYPRPYFRWYLFINGARAF